VKSRGSEGRKKEEGGPSSIFPAQGTPMREAPSLSRGDSLLRRGERKTYPLLTHPWRFRPVSRGGRRRRQADRRISDKLDPKKKRKKEKREPSTSSIPHYCLSARRGKRARGSADVSIEKGKGKNPSFYRPRKGAWGPHGHLFSRRRRTLSLSSLARQVRKKKKKGNSSYIFF